MITTITKCDICKQDVDNASVFVLQVGHKMHDLCAKCHGAISKLFAGTGRDAPSTLSPWQLLTGELQNNPLIPSMPFPMIGGGIVGITTDPNYQNADMSSLPGGYIASSEVRQSIQDLNAYFETVFSSLSSPDSPLYHEPIPD